MSAPLVVNTDDGTVWTRREATRDGLALYAPEKCPGCPEFVMATYAELEGHGVAGTADVLPMPVPVGPEPLTAERLTEIEARANAATSGPWCTDAWEIYQGTEYVPGISFWIGETCRGTADLEQDRADAAFVAAARSDVPALVAEVRRLRAERADRQDEVAAAVGYTSGLEWSDLVGIVASNTTSLVQAERDVRALKARIAELEAERHSTIEAPDALTTVFVPVASLREPEGEFYPFLHREGRVPHDLDETGGV